MRILISPFWNYTLTKLFSTVKGTLRAKSFESLLAKKVCKEEQARQTEITTIYRKKTTQFPSIESIISLFMVGKQQFSHYYP